jgi:hypothetical protein
MVIKIEGDPSSRSVIVVLYVLESQFVGHRDRPDHVRNADAVVNYRFLKVCWTTENTALSFLAKRGIRVILRGLEK